MPLTLGVISDTHVPDRVRQLDPQAFGIFQAAGVQAILHAGDVSGPQLLAQLEQIAPVYAVKGNRDFLWLPHLPAELRLGRCYLPERAWRGGGLAPADLLNPASEARLRPLYLRYLDMAEEHLEAGWAYTNHLPRGNLRVRLACAWPILIGMQTLTKLRTGQVLEGSRRIKISRKEVRQVLVRSVFWYPWPGRWHGLLNAYRQQPKHVASASNFS